MATKIEFENKEVLGPITIKDLNPTDMFIYSNTLFMKIFTAAANAVCLQPYVGSKPGKGYVFTSEILLPADATICVSSIKNSSV